MLKKTLIPMLALAMLVVAIGCSDNTSAPAVADTPNLTDEFGGYTATSEAPAFGDADLAATEAEEEEIDDVLLASPAVAEMVDDPNCGRFHFRAVWGQLCYDSTHTDPTDWTGSLTASRGALVIKRLIRFELNQDGYLPRTTPELVEWFSTTTVHNDGIAVDLFVPPVVDTSFVVDTLGDTTVVCDTIPGDPVTLTFETGPHTQTFTLDELASLDTVVTLADSNAVAFHSLQVFPNQCRRGHLVGRWGYDSEGNGVFNGVWHNRRGWAVGHVQGHFGQDDNGNNVFYGKWIDRTGKFEGLVKGTWGPNPNVNANSNAFRHAGGWFRGEICDSDGAMIGELKGKYKSSPELGRGWFQARWKLNCDDVSAGSGDGRLYDDGF